MTTIRSMSLALALASLGAGLQGCVHSTPEFDRQFGMATRANLAVQVLDPAAAANQNPATGMDGRAAKGAHERYQRSFAQPETAPAPLFITTGSAR